MEEKKLLFALIVTNFLSVLAFDANAGIDHHAHKQYESRYVDQNVIDMVNNLNSKVDGLTDLKGGDKKGTNTQNDLAERSAREIIDVTNQRVRNSQNNKEVKELKEWTQDIETRDKKHVMDHMLCESQKQQEMAGHFQQTNTSQDSKFYIFASVSLSKQVLKNLVRGAKKYDGVVVIRGIIDDSLTKTVGFLREVLKEDAEGVLIDPMLFRKYEIKMVPSYVLAITTPGKEIEDKELSKLTDETFDMIGGTISPGYALSTFASKGNLKAQAKMRLADD